MEGNNNSANTTIKITYKPDIPTESPNQKLDYFALMAKIEEITPLDIATFRNKLPAADQEKFDGMPENKKLIICVIDSIPDNDLLQLKNPTNYLLGFHQVSDVVTLVLDFRKKMKQQELL